MARIRMGSQTAASVPTPPAGKATIFLDSADLSFKAKLPNGSLIPISATEEYIQDVFANFIVDSSTVNFTYNDLGNLGTFEVVQSALDIFQIPVIPTGNLTSTNVGAALNELQSDIDTRALHLITTNLIFVDTNGNDSTGDGTLEKPYRNITHALNITTTATSSNPFKIKVGPGVYTGTLTMKPYIWVEGAEQDQTIVVASSGDHAVYGADNCGISKCLLTGATTASKAAVYYRSTIGTTNTSFFVEDIRFGQNDTLGISDASIAPTAIFLENCKIGGVHQFNHGFLAQAGGRVIARNCTTTGLTAPYPDYVFKGTGTGSQIVINGMQIRSGTITSGSCIHLADGALLRALSVNIRNFAKAVWIQNTGAASVIDAVSILCESNTQDLVVEHPSADGTFNGSADHNKIFIHPSSSFSVVISCNAQPSDNTGSVTVGDILQGDRYDRISNLSLLARKATTLGLIEDVETPFIEFDSGLNVQIVGGTGFLNEPIDLYLIQVNWTNQTLTIPANSTKYVFVDHEGNVLTSDAPTDPETTIILGRINSGPTEIRFIENSDLPMNHYGNKTENFLRTVLGPTFASGCLVSESATPLKLDVTAGKYYYGVTEFFATGGTAIEWETFYRNGSGGYTSVPNQDTVSNSLYDNGSGTLVSIPTGKYARHHLYVVGDGGNEKWFLIQAQEIYDSEAEALDGPLPVVPSFFTDALTRVAGIIVQEGNANVVSILDLRIRPGQAAPSGTSVTAHGDLTGLLNDDHVQYLLANGTRAMSGSLNMGGQDIANVDLVDGRDIAADGSKLDTIEVGATADQIASEVPFTPVGTISATNVQTALAEVDSEKVPNTRQINAGTGLSGGGDLSADRSISMPNVGTAGSYGSASQVPVITTDAQGRVSAVVNTAISITSSAVTNFAATVLSTVLAGYTIGTSTALAATDTILQAFGKIQGQISVLFARQINAGTGLTGGGDLTTDRTISMPNVGTAGSKGSATEVPVFTTDAQGRVTASTNTPINGVPAANITNTPAGNIGATNVQAAINELDSEKQPLDGDLTAISNLAGTGLVTRTATNTMTTRTITGTAGEVDVTNGDGVSGNPTVALPNVGTANTVGATNSTLTITTDAKGRVTTKVANLISIVSSQVSDFAATVLSTVLTGYTVGANTAIAATDTVLQAFAKVQGQLNALFNRNINTGTGLQGGGNLTADRTLSLTNTGVAAGSYGSSGFDVGQFSVDAQGRLTLAQNTPITFGRHYQSFEDTVQSNSNSGAQPLTAVASSFTTSALTAGEYALIIQYYWTSNSGAADARFQLFVDGVAVGNRHNEELQDTNTNQIDQIIENLVLTAGTHTIELRFGGEAGSTTTVNRVVCQLWRVA